MKEFLKRVWLGIKRFFFSTFFVWIGVLLGVIAGLIFNQSVGMIVFFSVVGGFIGFVFIRQIWWFISGTGDYMGRVGLLKKLWLLIFGKNEEDSDSEG